MNGPFISKNEMNAPFIARGPEMASGPGITAPSRRGNHSEGVIAFAMASMPRSRSAWLITSGGAMRRV